MRDDFSTFDINKALEIPRERLRDWMVRGFVEPSVQAEGAGTRAVFDRIDVYLVALFEDLLEGGLSRSMAAIFTKQLRRNKRIRATLDTTNYIVFKKLGTNKWEVTTSKVETEKISIDEDRKVEPGWKQVIIYNFRSLRKRVDERLNSL